MKSSFWNVICRNRNNFSSVVSKRFHHNRLEFSAISSKEKYDLLNANNLHFPSKRFRTIHSIHDNLSTKVSRYQFNDSLLGNFNKFNQISLLNNLQSRNLMSQNHSSSNKSDKEAQLKAKYRPKECKFKAPYGHIAGLEWGKPENPHKILCMHGWLDNSGSFERLIPFILDHEDNAQKYHIVAIDQPGVGLSSHKPPGADYTQFSTVMDMRRVTQQMKWDRVILLGHSLGSHLSFLYSCVYPEQVETFITIDLAHPVTRQVQGWNVAIANSIEEHFKCEYHYEDDPTTNIRVPVYSEVDALKRLMLGHSNSLTKESAEVLLKRGAKKQRWGYTFNRDIRLRHASLELRADDSLMLQNLNEPFRPYLFIIRANQSPYHRPDEVRLQYYELFKKNCPMFRDITMDGTHHLHMNTPELVAPEINKFLADVRQDVQAKLNKSNL